jgi:NAD+-dependent farnesol dehydrogenase
MRVLVTGGTGYLGRAIVRALHARGHDPVIFARSAAASGLPGHGIDGDVRDEPALERAARGCDAICHSAALVSVWRRRRQDFDEVNVGGLENVLRVAARLRLSRIVYTSSFLALPPDGGNAPRRWNDYQRTKVIADGVATRAVERGAPLIRTYPGVIYGPGRLTEGNLVGHFIEDHLAGRLPGIIGASRRWSYAYVDDVAAGHVAAVEQGRVGARYFLGGENAPQIRVFEIVRDLTGQALPRRIPTAVAALVALADEVRARLFDVPPRLTLGTLEILDCDWTLSSDLAIAELGYHITPLAEGVARVVSDLRRDVNAATQAAKGGNIL